MDIKKITINNFFSIKNATIQIKDGITAIIGNNLDSDRSNGSGKSSIFISVFWCLYGETPKNITSTEVVRRGETQCYVEVEFEYNDKVYVVRRSRGEKVNFIATVNKEQITEDELHKQIPSYQSFCLAMHAQDSVRFLQLSDSEKKAILLSIVDFDTEEVLEMMKDDLKKIVLKQNELITKEKVLATELNTLKNTSFPFSEEEKNMILKGETLPILNQLRLEYAELKSSMLEEGDSVSSKIITIQESLQNLTTKEQLNKALEKNYKYTKELEKIENETFPTISCPHCRNKFVLNEQELLELKRRKIINIQSMMIPKEEIESMKKEVETRELLLKQLNSLKEELYSFKEKQKEVTNKLSAISSKGIDIKNKIEQFKTINLKIKEKENEILDIKKELEELNVKIGYLEDAIKVLSPSGVQSYITDLVIHQINIHIEQILNMLFPTISFVLSSQSVLKSGKSSTKIGENLLIEGKSINLGSLSGGELRSLYIAVDLAIMLTIEKFLGIKFKTLLLDEPFDGLDSQGRVIALETLASLFSDRKILIIEHSSELNTYYNNCINVIKKEGVSYVS